MEATTITEKEAEEMSGDDTILSEIRDLERKRQHALTSLDVASLDQILADDLIHVHSTGMVHDKAQFISHVQRMGGFRFVERGDLTIKIEGDVAIITGPATNGVRSPHTGEDVTLVGFSTIVARKTRQGWQIILSQLTPFRDPPSPNHK